jgi:RNA polymerase sigma factor (sigma-70 family)
MSVRTNVKFEALVNASANGANDAARAKKIGPTVEQRNVFIMEHRALALGLARRILRRWGAFLPADEVLSGADLALCEAASKYVPQSGAEFSTYLYYFVKGQMFRLLANARGDIGEESRKPQDDGDTLRRVSLETEMMGDDDTVGEGASSTLAPDESTFRAELRKICADALRELSAVERKVIVASRVEDEDMVGLAKSLGYSRGYLFAMRKAAEKRLKLHLKAMGAMGELEDLAA